MDSRLPLSAWARRKLRINDGHLAALREGCPDFVEADLVIHVRSCDTCTETVLRSKLFSTWTIARVADWERLFALAEPGTAALRFTTFRPCDRCGVEIYGTRWPGERGPRWANRLDNRLHSCADFRDIPEVVEAWSRSPRRPGRASRLKRWS